MPTIYPYTITNSYKGGFYMRTYGRNVRRAWDGEDYRAPKRMRLDNGYSSNMYTSADGMHGNENANDVYDLEDNLERAIRETSVAALSSSPSRKNSTVFSLNECSEENGVSSTITPPSSPPPTLDITPPVVKARKSTFSYMEKKKQKEKEKLKALKQQAAISATQTKSTSAATPRETSEPLSEIHNSSSRAQSQPALVSESSTEIKSVPAKSLTQTVLDFGQSLQPVTCPQCQMSYTPSAPEDTRLHSMFHNRHRNGIELGKPFLKAAMKWCYEVPHIPGSVVVVDRKISLPGRRAVKSVLEVVNKELGSVDIPESDLWSQKTLDTDELGGPNEHTKKVDRYKAFLHVVDGHCVGVCLAERIARAYKVRAAKDFSSPPGTAQKATDVEHHNDTDPQASIPTPASTSPNLSESPDSRAQAQPAVSNSSADLDLDSESTTAVVGVSRIWTSDQYRRKGIAQNLLECVVNQFIYGMEIHREEVAFSQPTEMGVALAKGWFGEQIGWTVYHET